MPSERHDKNSTHLIRHRYDLAMSQGAIFAGVDEVGRGCLAGPVVAAAVVLPTDVGRWHDVNDSKQLRDTQREKLYEMIIGSAPAVGIGQASVREIDDVNILVATQLAMGRAIANLGIQIELALVDGNQPANTEVPSLPVVKGDARSLAIAAASVVAKVYRDKYMRALHEDFPVYRFDKNVGYGTPVHLMALETYGPSAHHRVTFAPVRRHFIGQARLTLHG